MAFGGFNKGGDGAPMAEINMVPLIDVMLVLLVIFIITAPLLTHAVNPTTASRTTYSSASAPKAMSTGTARRSTSKRWKPA